MQRGECSECSCSDATVPTKLSLQQTAWLRLRTDLLSFSLVPRLSQEEDSLEATGKCCQPTASVLTKKSAMWPTAQSFCCIFSPVVWYPLIVSTLHDWHCMQFEISAGTYASEFMVLYYWQEVEKEFHIPQEVVKMMLPTSYSVNYLVCLLMTRRTNRVGELESGTYGLR